MYSNVPLPPTGPPGESAGAEMMSTELEPERPPPYVAANQAGDHQLVSIGKRVKLWRWLAVPEKTDNACQEVTSAGSYSSCSSNVQSKSLPAEFEKSANESCTLFAHR